MKRWPLFVIAAPAATAVWSGWVGLGQLCGFGLVQPFPGIVSWHLDTAITLPVGVEAYGSYALAAWLAPGTPDRAKRFARRSAIAALALGMLGQVIYHLLAAAHATRAPWPVTMLVACLPVAVLGLGVALAHLMRAGADIAETPDIATDTGRTQEADTVRPPDADTGADTTPDTGRTQQRPAPRTRKRTQSGRGQRSGADTQAAYLSAVTARPDASVADLAADMGVSPRTVRRVRAALNGHVPDPEEN